MYTPIYIRTRHLSTYMDTRQESNTHCEYIIIKSRVVVIGSCRMYLSIHIQVHSLPYDPPSSRLQDHSTAIPRHTGTHHQMPSPPRLPVHHPCPSFLVLLLPPPSSPQPTTQQHHDSIHRDGDLTLIITPPPSICPSSECFVASLPPFMRGTYGGGHRNVSVECTCEMYDMAGYG